MGLVSHEAPRLTATGPVPYDDYDAHRPLETGMVVSVETTMKHPTRGFIKLEDTVAVTDNGLRDLRRGRPRLEQRRQRTGALRPLGLNALRQRRSGLFHVSARLQPALEAAEIADVGITHVLQGLADER